MRVVAVVPMKLNNSRLPQKNTRPFTNGAPLCTYIFQTLLGIGRLDGVYAYCSSPAVEGCLPDGVTFLERPSSLDTDRTSITEVLREFADDVPADIYLLAHATAPFIKRESIEGGLDAVLSGEYDSAFSAKKLQGFLWGNGQPLNYPLDCIPRTQDLPVLYEETSGFYIYGGGMIKNRGRRIGDKPFIAEVSEVEAIDIDEEGDFIIADAIYNFLFRPGKGGGAI